MQLNNDKIKNILKVKKKCSTALAEIDDFSQELKKIRNYFSEKLEQIENDKKLKNIVNRIQNQPQLHYEDFTKQEKIILGYLAHGLSDNDIKENLSISDATLKHT